MDIPVTPQAHPFRAPYSPAALMAYSKVHEPSPTRQQVGEQRFSMRQGVRKDGLEQLARSQKLHDHFSRETLERKFAHHEGLMDIHDAVSVLFLFDFTPS